MKNFTKLILTSITTIIISSIAAKEAICCELSEIEEIKIPQNRTSVEIRNSFSVSSYEASQSIDCNKIIKYQMVLAQEIKNHQTENGYGTLRYDFLLLSDAIYNELFRIEEPCLKNKSMKVFRLVFKRQFEAPITAKKISEIVMGEDDASAVSTPLIEKKEDVADLGLGGKSALYSKYAKKAEKIIQKSEAQVKTNLTQLQKTVKTYLEPLRSALISQDDLGKDSIDSESFEQITQLNNMSELISHTKEKLIEEITIKEKENGCGLLLREFNFLYAAIYSELQKKSSDLPVNISNTFLPSDNNSVRIMFSNALQSKLGFPITSEQIAEELYGIQLTKNRTHKKVAEIIDSSRKLIAYYLTHQSEIIQHIENNCLVLQSKKYYEKLSEIKEINEYLEKILEEIKALPGVDLQLEETKALPEVNLQPDFNLFKM